MKWGPASGWSRLFRWFTFSGGAQADTSEAISDRRFANQLNKYYSEEIEPEHGARDPETNVTNDDLALTGKIA